MAHAPDSQHTDCESVVNVEVLSGPTDKAGTVAIEWAVRGLKKYA